MKGSSDRLSRQYVRKLRDYLTEEQEAILQQAYDLGRHAVAVGLGVLDMAKIHQAAMVDFLQPELNPEEMGRVLRTGETFFLESLSPYEVTHRGFREANLKLHRLIETLEERNAALRESEKHYRELFNEARIMQENLRTLSNQILHAQEAERKRISRELHDEVGQALMAISVNLGVLKREGQGGAENLAAKVAHTQHLLEQTMEAVHRFARELRPSMLDDLGLLPALRSYVEAFAERTGIPVRFRATAQMQDLDGEQRTVLYRVAQESLNNVAKHARASRVEVTIRRRKNRMYLEVKDNGRAFQHSPEAIAKGKERLGLLGMQERVRLVNGEFAIDAQPGKGTTIRVEIPVGAGGA